MRRREFIAVLGGAAVAWPLAARAQQPAMPVIGFMSGRALNGPRQFVDAFRTGLQTNGYVEGQNVAVEYRWAEGRYERLPALAADLVRRQVAVIVTAGRSCQQPVSTLLRKQLPHKRQCGNINSVEGVCPAIIVHPSNDGVVICALYEIGSVGRIQVGA